MSFKLDTLRSDPDFVSTYLRTEANVLRSLSPIEALLYAPSIVSDINPHESYLRFRSEENVIRRSVLDFEMFVDLDDEGISQQLIRTGVHERRATAIFRRELEKVEAAVDDITVLEIGGNIGYYTIVECATLDDPTIYVVEPEPSNIDLLTANVELNGHQSNVEITQGAISSESGTTTLYLSEHSNCHTIESGDERYSGETIEIQTWTADDFLDERGLEPEDLNVVRMDVEGHEADVFEGMSDVLSTEGPMLVFVELHQVLLETDELEPLLRKIRRNEFELVYACVDHFARDPLAETRSIDDIEEILKDHGNVEVFVKKGY